MKASISESSPQAVSSADNCAGARMDGAARTTFRESMRETGFATHAPIFTP